MTSVWAETIPKHSPNAPNMTPNGPSMISVHSEIISLFLSFVTSEIPLAHAGFPRRIFLPLAPDFHVGFLRPARRFFCVDFLWGLQGP